MSGIHDELHVFLNTTRIGTLAQDNGILSFAYSPEYLRSPDAYPLSQNLPLTDEVFHDPAVENFFSNLLPDERIRATVAMILHVSEDNTFGMLKRIGADCAGAVSFYPAGQTPQSPSDPVYRDLSDDEAYRILDNLGQRPWTSATKVSASLSRGHRKNWSPASATGKSPCRFTERPPHTSSNRRFRTSPTACSTSSSA